MRRATSLAWRSLAVGAAYAATRGLTNAVLGKGADPHSLIWLLVGGTAIGLTLGPSARSMPASAPSHLLVWGSIVFLNLASVTIEGRFFAPGHVQGPMALLLLQQLAASLVAAWFIMRLFGPIAEATPAPATRRSWFSWVGRFVASALSYLLFYYFFGAINYLLVTGPYYRAQQGGLVTPAPSVILQAELVRAPLIILSVVPFLLNFRGTGRHAALFTGLILFGVGGLAPLLMTVEALPLLVITASAVEIFFQNFCTGLVAARLLGMPQPVEGTFQRHPDLDKE